MTRRTDPLIADIWLIRHAPALDGVALAGRRDVDADCRDGARLAALTAKVGRKEGDHVWTSPARRCQQTAAALFGQTGQADPRLWEQDFGAWEGRSYADLPDLGPLSQAELADFAPPGGESFAALSLRVSGVLCGFGAGRHIIVAHAGVIRAALGCALGAAHLGLGFALAAPSLTHLSRDLTSGAWVIHGVNWTPT